MSAEQKTPVVQMEVKPPTLPSLNELNPLNSSDPLVKTIVNGEIPTNNQLNDALDRAMDSLTVTKKEVQLNEKGEQLIGDATDILESAQKLINERNKNDMIQNLVKHTKEATEDLSKEVSNQASKLDLPSLNIGSLSQLTSFFQNQEFYFPKEEVKGDAQTAYNCGKELISYAIRSSEFRSFLIEIINLFQGAINNASDKLNEIADASKNDVRRGDLEMKGTTEVSKRVAEDTKESVEVKTTEWTEQTRREYYNKFSNLLNRISQRPEYRRILDLYWKWMDEVAVRGQEVSKLLAEKAQEIKDQAIEKANELSEKASVAKDQVLESAEQIADRTNFDRVWNDVKEIVDQFCGRGSFDALYSESWKLYTDLYNDREANQYFASMKAYVIAAINDPTLLNRSDKMKEGEDLLERGRKLFTSAKYTRKFNHLLDSGVTQLNKIANDPLTNDLALKLKKFGEHFACDEQGRPDLYVIQNSMGQLKQMVYPMVSKQLENITIARVAGSNDSYDWAVENLLISIPNLIPEYFELKTKNLLQVNVKALEAERNITKVVLDIKCIKPVFKDVKFWYKRKSFPYLEDQGIVDVDLSGGVGTRIKIIWKLKSKSNRPFAFSLMEVKCVIDKMDIRVKDAKHEILDKIVTSLFIATIKQSVAQGIVNNIIESLQPINDSMNNWFTQRPISSIYDKVNNQVHSLYEKGNEVLHNQPIQKAVEYAKESIEYVKEKANETLEVVKDKAQVSYEEASKKTEQLKEQAVQFANENLPEKAFELKDQAVEKATELKDQAVQKATELKEQVMEKGAELKEQAVEKGTELKNEIANEKWNHGWQKTSKKGWSKQVKKQQKKLKTENPYDILSEESFPTLSVNENISAK